MPRLPEKVALVTGSSSGLGRAIALSFAEEGTKLIVCADLTPSCNGVSSKTEDAEEEEPTHELICRVFGEGRAIFVKCDVTIEEEVEVSVKLAVQTGGRLDVLVNNAGTGPDGSLLHELESARFEKIFKLNTQGTFNGCKYALAQFIQQDLDVLGERGRIINIASGAGLKAARKSAAYSASKAAVIALTKGMATDYAEQKIYVNALCPGFFQTAMTQHLFENEAARDYMKSKTPYWNEGKNVLDVAKAALYLASSEATWLTGVALPVDGGFAAQ